MARIGRGLAVLTVVCLTLSGCTLLQTWDSLWVSTPKGDLILSGSPRDVALMMQSRLNQLGLMVTQNGDGDTVRISSSSPSGKKFTMVLERDKEGPGTRTRVRIDWENGKDEEMHAKLLAAGTAPGR